MEMEEGSSSSSSSSSTAFVDDATKFRKSLKELRGLSSQLYHVADYCETAFCTSRNKAVIVDSTKDYVSRAVVAMVDHLGSMSATLELSVSRSNSVLEAQPRIDILKQRIGACQQYPQKLALVQYQWNSADFSRFHCRYIWSPLKDSTTMSSALRASVSCIDAKNVEGIQIPAKEPLLSDTHKCNKKDVVHDSRSIMAEENNRGSPSVGSFRDYKNFVPPVHDGLWALPKPEQDSKFQLQESQRPKRRTIKKSKVSQKKVDLAAALIRRGKRILA